MNCKEPVLSGKGKLQILRFLGELVCWRQHPSTTYQRTTIVLTMLFGVPWTAWGQTKYPATCAPNGNMVLSSNAVFFTTLELYSNCRISFAPNIDRANIVADNLILHGVSTIDLTPSKPVPRKATPGTEPKQVPQRGAQTPGRGSIGGPGDNGRRGADGIALDFTIGALDATDGSLWIKTDGGPAGDGGDGGKGSSGPCTCFYCTDGGNGGTGGTGGDGGKGESTAKVTATINGKNVSALPFTQTTPPNVAPSSMPPEATANGVVVIYGHPGKGGAGGLGGPAGVYIR